MSAPRAVLPWVQPTMELVLQPPAPGTEPLAALLITLAAVWLFGAPWVQLCWWLGARTRRAGVVAPSTVTASSPPEHPAGTRVQQTVRLAVLVLALGGGLRELRS